MSQYIATNDANGQAVFSKDVPSEQHMIDVPNGTVRLVNSTYEMPPNVESNEGVLKYSQDRLNMFPDHRLCPPGGTSTLMFTMSANGTSRTHRTMTHDTVVVIEGVVELHLDGGEMRTLRAGDVVTMRATMHKWINVTPNGGDVRMIAFVQDIPGPIKFGEKVLDTDWTTRQDSEPL